MTKSASVGILILGSNTLSSLLMPMEVSSWAFGAFLPVYFPIVP